MLAPESLKGETNKRNPPAGPTPAGLTVRNETMTIRDQQRRRKSWRTGAAFLTINDGGQVVVEVRDNDGYTHVDVVRAANQVSVGLQLGRVLASDKIKFAEDYTTDPQALEICRELT